MNNKNLTIGIIDLGSNSIRLQIASVLGKSYRIVHEYKEIVRIGDDFFQHGFLSEASITKIYNCLKDINKIIESYNVDIVRGVATATLREATNGKEILKTIHENHGIELKIISGEEEAALSYLAISGSFQIDKYNAIITDIGGGSAEFTISIQGNIKEIDSLKIGCARLKNKFLKNNPPKISEISEMKDFINQSIGYFPYMNIDLVICTGGTINNIANVYYLKTNKDSNARVKYVPRKFLKDFINKVKFMDYEKIASIKGVEPKRADILLPAAIIIETILSKISADSFYTFSGGLRTGLIIDTLNSMNIKMPFQNLGEDICYSRLIETGNKFLFEEEHAKHVAFLADKLFSELSDELNLNSEQRKIMEAAALLHDIGNYISFSKHHKHSCYLIKNSDLAGFNYKQKLMIAHTARYHRKSHPKKKHEIYQDLTVEEIDTVEKLSAILRVADGLDRGHKNYITDIQLEITDNKITVIPESDNDITLEKKGFDTKKDLLESISSKKVEIS